MDASRQAVLYLRLKKRIYIRPGQPVTLGLAARLLAMDEEQEQKLSELMLYRHSKSDGNRVVIDLLQIVKAIRVAEPSLTVEAYGDPQVLIMISAKPVKPRIVVLVFAWLLLFFGAGLAIMNFHTDVSMREVHIRIVELITGHRNEHPLWFQIPYSLGIGLGMILFFNHLFRKRFNEEPNPLEVELYTYQENVNAYVIADEMRKKYVASGGREGDDG
ncbi:stage V sporulation protein AA [Paenibacillus sp. NEAU-GSW1]|uniref:stage V sporulation protein AA n=1 Tax=Paenibacillus sp. NEAU-GSW1 TaxID=2682486 RepID=UPI0012E32AB4|nr:stage V sporulation protein AA [Paenibacillus sp. NEAU-GSW1]MUT65542.1 stage V sporulation protein AA [Paenibacillus sp. NEAU-GSW1]